MDPFTFAILTGILATLGAAALIGIVSRSPKLMRKVKRWFVGTNFLPLGPAASGKTSFINYLKHDQFADIYPTKTTVEVKPLDSFSVDKGGDFNLEIAKGSDIPGDLSVMDQIDIARKNKTETLILLVSLSDPNAGAWLSSACSYLNTCLLHDRALTKKLKSLTIVMNKKDEVTEEIIQQRKGEFEAIVKKELGPVLGDNIGRVSVLPCTLLKSKGGEKAANDVLLTIITSLIKAKPLAKK